MIIVQVVWPMLAVILSVFGMSNFSPARWYEFFVGKGQYTLFLSESRNYNVSEESGGSIRAWNVAIVVFAVLARISTNMQYVIILSGFCVASFTIWVMTSNFMETVSKQISFGDPHSLDRIIDRLICVKQLNEKYRELADTTQAINATWSGLCFWFILYSCAWMSTELDKIIQSNNYPRIVFDGAEMISFVAALILSAECNRKV